MVSPAETSSTTKIGEYVRDDTGNSSSSSYLPRQAPIHPFPPAAEGEDLPLYTQDNSDVWKEIDDLASALLEHDGDDLPITKYPVIADESPTSTRRAQVVKLYYEAITKADMQLLTAILERGLVTPETINEAGRTPLLAAVEAEKATSVRFLIDSGADTNAYGITETVKPKSYEKKHKKKQHTYRTPLQYAAQLGNFTIVKVLRDNGADDALIAPDGQLALRLAATTGHREIVDFLPRQRGGGFKRWKVKHTTAMHRCEKAARGILMFGRVLIYEIPKFIVWSVPKHLLALPVWKRAKWLHAHKAEIPELIAKKLQEVWEWLKEVPTTIWEGVKKAPGALKRFAKGTAKFVVHLVKATCELITRIPGAIAIAMKWLWDGVKKTCAAIGNLFVQLFSFVHTVIAAVVSFFQRITLWDIWHVFTVALHAIFVDALVKIWGWLCSVGTTCEKIFEKLFGCIGWLLWILAQGIMWTIVYVPVELASILVACGGSLKAGLKEVLVWFDPKRG